MNARVYFRGRKKDKFVLITDCPSEFEAVIFAIHKYGQSVDFVQDEGRKQIEGKTLLTQIKYEDEKF